MLEEDRPPFEIWLDDEALEKHFKEVQVRRDAKMGSGQGMESVPDAGEEMPMAENEYTAALMGGR